MLYSDLNYMKGKNMKKIIILGLALILWALAISQMVYAVSVPVGPGTEQTDDLDPIVPPPPPPK